MECFSNSIGIENTGKENFGNIIEKTKEHDTLKLVYHRSSTYHKVASHVVLFLALHGAPTEDRSSQTKAYKHIQLSIVLTKNSNIVLTKNSSTIP
jgi:hypothetical protein